MAGTDGSPPVQDMSQVMAMMGQLIASQQQQQEAMLKLIADKTSGPSSVTGLSSLARSVDTRGVLKCEKYHGEKDKFMSWKKIFYSSLELINPILGYEAKRHRNQFRYEI